MDQLVIHTTPRSLRAFALQLLTDLGHDPEDPGVTAVVDAHLLGSAHAGQGCEGLAKGVVVVGRH